MKPQEEWYSHNPISNRLLDLQLPQIPIPTRRRKWIWQRIQTLKRYHSTTKTHFLVFLINLTWTSTSNQLQTNYANCLLISVRVVRTQFKLMNPSTAEEENQFEMEHLKRRRIVWGLIQRQKSLHKCRVYRLWYAIRLCLLIDSLEPLLMYLLAITSIWQVCETALIWVHTSHMTSKRVILSYLLIVRGSAQVRSYTSRI